MGDGYGKLLILLLAIGLILLTMTSKGRQAIAVLIGKTVSQTIPESNPTNLSVHSGGR